MAVRSIVVAVPAQTLARRSEISRPSCLQGVHWPQDSTARKRATPAATAAMSSRWS